MFSAKLTIATDFLQVSPADLSAPQPPFPDDFYGIFCRFLPQKPIFNQDL
jgi:hypothetical protein